MKARFVYRDIKGNKIVPRIIRKIKENEDDVVKQCNNCIPNWAYVLIYIGEDKETFQNSLRCVGDNFDGCLINFTSIYPIKNGTLKNYVANEIFTIGN